MISPIDSPRLPSSRPRKFAPGQLLATPAALQALSAPEIQQALARYFSGDWGDCCPEDAAANDHALRDGGRLLSDYHSGARQKFWIITEADRSATTVLLPEDY